VGCDAGCLVPGKQPERVAADATAVGDPGVASVGATFYAFLGDGHLVMSNDAWHNVSRWSRRDFVPIETRAWYVGSGAPPANASLPSPEELRVAKPILDAMVGLPEGGVTSAVLDDPIVKDLFGGALYATVRIDELG
jgi:hypothetical protein